MKANVLGFGVMGRQITALLQLMGYNVFVWTRNFDNKKTLRHKKEIKLLKRHLPVTCVPGEATYIDQISRLKARMTFEVLSENIEVKKKALNALPYNVKQIDLFTNTSSYAPQEIVPSGIGLHFFNPIYALKFAEITCDPSMLNREGQTLIQNIEKLGFEIIQTSSNRGYIGNYILFQEISAALKLVDLYGYKSATIDKVLAHMGRSVSLFDIIDLIGVKVVKSIMENLKQEDPFIYLSPLLEQAIESNILGRQNNTSIRNMTDR